ncbi:hypothetical protein NEF87_002313 [Candidatus Lokiarchaeum ossiferum]|uniref:4Fe-4S ferredoxin n=1 Tax=Candidatus Lokiarchaeum ossiferum TaxID=2951803 RepID=A0ABY6HR94_9ARCH|nr:hypothetical protein NEF87_002313 [Candidatus Lokiarchaeum sp. B-35]
MKVGIFYFSGTGNTKIVAKIIKQELKNQNHIVVLHKIEDLLKEAMMFDTKHYDMVGIGYPVHALNAPRLIYQFIQILGKDTRKRVFLFKTAGDPLWLGGPTSLLRKRLKKKEFDVFYEFLEIMPANVVVSYDEKLVKQLYQLAEVDTRNQVQNILAGQRSLQKLGFFKSIFSLLFSTMESLGVKIVGKCFRVSLDCTNCGACILGCPMQNIIRKNDRIKFKFQCSLCMRCIYSCPVNAIHPRIFRFFEIKRGYNIKPIITDSSIKGDFLSSETKGFFKRFAKYFGLNE